MLLQKLLSHFSSEFQQRHGAIFYTFVNMPKVISKGVNTSRKKRPPPFLTSYSSTIVIQKAVEGIYTSHLMIVFVHNLRHQNFHIHFLCSRKPSDRMFSFAKNAIFCKRNN